VVQWTHCQQAFEKRTLPFAGAQGWPPQLRTCRRSQESIESKLMTDLVYIGVVVLFFVVSGLYVRACEKM
jgi:hypothetical protein